VVVLFWRINRRVRPRTRTEREREPEPERRTANRERRTANGEPRTANRERERVNLEQNPRTAEPPTPAPKAAAHRNDLSRFAKRAEIFHEMPNALQSCRRNRDRSIDLVIARRSHPSRRASGRATRTAAGDFLTFHTLCA
jgi:hypothetical protein